MPYLEIFAEFRQNIRTHARSLNATDILKECDRIRDEVLPNVGVRLEDREGEGSAVKLVDHDVLLKEKEAKKLAELERNAEKERKNRKWRRCRPQKRHRKEFRPVKCLKVIQSIRNLMKK